MNRYPDIAWFDLMIKEIQWKINWQTRHGTTAYRVMNEEKKAARIKKWEQDIEYLKALRETHPSNIFNEVFGVSKEEISSEN